VRTALIDADILLYEVGFSAQRKETDDNGQDILNVMSFDWTRELLESKIDLIVDESGSDDYRLYVTNTGWLNESLNRSSRLFQPPVEFVPNFRLAVAEEGQEKAYKGQRVVPKPFHYKNLQTHLCGVMGAIVSHEGLEADDLICIEQTKMGCNDSSIICSRDKDLRQCHGWTYSWEVGKQPSFGPTFVEGVGELIPHYKPTKTGKRLDKVLGTGPKFFYYQMLTGDSVDNIAGLYGYGPAFALKELEGAKTERECYEVVSSFYKKEFPDTWKERMITQSKLLYIIKEMEDGHPKFWKPPAKDN